MGRLSNLIVNTTSTNISSGNTSTTDDNNLSINILSGTTTGITNIDVHIFIDENGNVTQIKKYSKPRLKYYIDPNFPDAPIQEYCVIGVSDPIDGDCSEGTAMGVGDNEFGGLMVYAIYE
jgi:hypothetical protein